MSDELEHPGDSAINVDAIVEAFSDDHHHDDEEEGYSTIHDEDEDDGNFMDTNSEIMNDDKHW